MRFFSRWRLRRRTPGPPVLAEEFDTGGFQMRANKNLHLVPLKSENSLGILSRDPPCLVGWQRIHTREAAGHVANIVRVIGAIKDIVDRASDLEAEFECVPLIDYGVIV
jgi:hypothetical protein